MAVVIGLPMVIILRRKKMPWLLKEHGTRARYNNINYELAFSESAVLFNTLHYVLTIKQF